MKSDPFLKAISRPLSRYEKAAIAGIPICVIIVSILFTRYAWREPAKPLPVNVDAIVTLGTQSNIIYFVDGDGVQVGSVTFNSRDEVTVTLKRKKP